MSRSRRGNSRITAFLFSQYPGAALVRQKSCLSRLDQTGTAHPNESRGKPETKSEIIEQPRHAAMHSVLLSGLRDEGMAVLIFRNGEGCISLNLAPFGDNVSEDARRGLLWWPGSPQHG